MPYNTEIPGWMTVYELKTLEKWAQELPRGSTVVEVGSMLGRSSYCIAASLNGGVLHCFDKWKNDNANAFPPGVYSDEEINHNNFPLSGTINSLETFSQNVSALANVHSYRVNSASDIKWDNTLIDMLFIDAAHENPADWDYIEFWFPLINPGGYITGHDYNIKDVDNNIQRLEHLTGNRAEKMRHQSLWRIKIPGSKLNE